MRYQARTLMVLLFLALIGFSSSRGQASDPDYYESGAQFQFSSLRDINHQFEQMQTELTSLRSQLKDVTNSSFACDGCDIGCGCAGGCDGGCGGSCGCDGGNCCRGSSWYAGYELTFLRPFVSDNAILVSTGGLVTGQFTDDDSGTGHRFVIGAENDCGVGARLRYWFFNHGHDFNSTAGPGSVGIDMDVIDLEVTLYERLCNWDLLVSGGIRYGRAQLSTLGEIAYFEGTGPTVSLEAQREFGCNGFYLVGNARGSLLAGDLANPTGGIGPRLDGEIATVLENQLGLGWSRCLDNSVLDLRLLWETQFWLNDTLANTIGSNLAFSGVTVAAQLRF